MDIKEEEKKYYCCNVCVKLINHVNHIEHKEHIDKCQSNFNNNFN